MINVDLPAYAEKLVSGANDFALSYAAKNITRRAVNLAFAATFQSLPGVSFVVNGPAPAPDAALTSLLVGSITPRGI